MAVSEKQKQYARAWDKENMKSFACRLRNNDAEAFKIWCQEHNTTPTAVLKYKALECADEWYKEQEKKRGSIK